MKKVSFKYIIWSIISIFLLICAIIFFAKYMKSSTYNKSLTFFDMEYIGDSDMPAKLNVEFITGKIGTRGDTAYYLAGDNDNIFVISMNEEFPEELEELKKYSYSLTEIKPKAYTIYGKSYKIEAGLKNLALNAYNQLYKENELTSDSFDDYFGEYYLNEENMHDKKEILHFILFITFSVLTVLSVASLVFYYTKKTAM